jgi:tetratricopeptide (TPR) repeat protein
VRAYQDANRITDPQKRIEAMEKFLADFPKSSTLYQAHQQMMNTLIKNTPDQKDRILLHAQKYIDNAPEFLRATAPNQVATALVDAGILLEKAEEFANKGLALAEEVQAKALRQARASNQALVGRIHLKKGKTKEAEKAFQAAYTALPLADATASTLKMAALGLAEIAEKDGKADKVVEYLTTASIFGALNATAKQQLETAYRKTHKDSLAGLEEMIDAKYEKVFPHPIKAQPYQPTPGRSNRTVLAEVFTGSGCPPCVAADLAFDAFLARHQRKDLIVLMYHQHIPLPDPMTNPSSLARYPYYSPRGVPTMAIDGDSSVSGGGPRSATQNTYDRLLPLIDKALETKAEAEIKLDATMTDSVIKVLANVTPTRSDASNLKLHIALAEEHLRFVGENGIRLHPMVVRSLAGEKSGGFALSEKPEAVSWRFDLNAITQEAKQALDEFETRRRTTDPTFAFAEKKHVIDPSHLSVVAFVQDEKTKKVLQAVSVKVNTAQTASGTK